MFGLPPVIEPTDTATHGLVLADVSGARMSDVVVDGFGRFGVLSVDSDLTLRGAEISDVIGTGLMAYGGSKEPSSTDPPHRISHFAGRVLRPLGLW